MHVKEINSYFQGLAMHYLFFGFIILLPIVDASSAEAMRRGRSDDNASPRGTVRGASNASEEYEMVPMMSQSLPLGILNFGGRERKKTAQTPNSPSTPQPQRRGLAIPYSASSPIAIQSPTSRREPLLNGDEHENTSSDEESIDGLPFTAEAWGMKNSQEIDLNNSLEFIVGSPEREKLHPTGD